MALTDPRNTLAYHNSRMLTTHRDMSATPLKNVTAALDAFMQADKAKDTCPESEALWFYGMNHGMSLIQAKRAPLEPLEGFEREFVTLYHDQMSVKAVRAFYYLLWICNREARHNGSLAKQLPAMKAEFGDACADFFASVVGGEDKIAKRLIADPPDCTIGTFVKCLAWQFYKCKWASNYGGKAWGNVTDCLVAFVHGAASAEVMLDTIWTLSHNTSAIFNKGHFYKLHTHSLIRVLDIQRSGQIPEGVLHDPVLIKFADPVLRHWMKALNENFPGKLGAYVDWNVVQALGAVESYPLEQQQQAKLHGMTPEAKAKMKAIEDAKIAAELAAAEAAAEEAKTNFEIMPNVYVKKVALSRAA